MPDFDSRREPNFTEFERCWIGPQPSTTRCCTRYDRPWTPPPTAISKSTCRFPRSCLPLRETDIEQLTEPISHILDKCTVGARLVLTSTSKELMVSVVGRGHTPGPGDEKPTEGIGTHEVVTLNGATWLTIRHPLPAAASDDILAYDHAV